MGCSEGPNGVGPTEQNWKIFKLKKQYKTFIDFYKTWIEQS